MHGEGRLLGRDRHAGKGQVDRLEVIRARAPLEGSANDIPSTAELVLTAGGRDHLAVGQSAGTTDSDGTDRPSQSPFASTTHHADLV